MTGNIAEKVLCDLKDHRQHGLTYFDKSLTPTRLRTKCISNVKEPWSSSVTSANALPTLVINSQLVLIGSLDLSQSVCKEIIFCKTK